jgi:large subunit ribosomal protein L35
LPKIKTNRAAAKRFRKTGGGKLKRSKAFRKHLLGKKSAKRKRNLRKPGLVDKADQARIKRLLVI